jgi:hypothetical protein
MAKYKMDGAAGSKGDRRYMNTEEGRASYRKWKDAKADPARKTTAFRRGDWMSLPKEGLGAKRSAILRKMGER